MTREEIQDIIQLASTGNLVPSVLPPARTQDVKKPDDLPSEDTRSYMTVEFRTVDGTQMVIQGNMAAAHLREIIKGVNHVQL